MIDGCVINSSQENPCSKCGEHPRVNNQRWCKLCRAAYKKESRLRNKKSQPATLSPQLLENTPPLMEPVPLLLDEANKALQEHEQAKRDYEELTNQNWRKSRVAPHMVLGPALQRILEAEKRCMSLGVSAS